MAIIRTGPIVSGISGTVGGVVFTTGHRGAAVRPRPITKYKTSEALAIARNRMNTVRAAWKELTPDQQSAWRTAAKDRPRTNALGLSSPIGAFQLFVKTSMTNLYAFEPIPTLPKTAGVGESVQNIVLSFSAAGDYEVEVDPIDAPAVATWIYYGWPFWTDKPTRSVPRVVFLKSLAAIGPTIDLRDVWVARFGELQVGQQFAVGVTGKLIDTDYPAKVIVRGEVAV